MRFFKGNGSYSRRQKRNYNNFEIDDICLICNKKISEHSKEEWIKCVKAEDDAMLDKIRKHYDR